MTALAVAALLALLPSGRTARAADARGGPPHVLLPALEREALAGGVATLRTPRSDMVLVPRGTFEMGSRTVELQLALEACRREPLGPRCEEKMFANELAAHQVTLSPFWLDRTEVALGEYRRCVAAGACSHPPYEEGGARFARDELPASLVSWADAAAYCKFAGKRLPTEAEWERAARGPSGRRFPWGEHYATRRANHGRFALDPTDATDGFAELAPVGAFPDGRTADGVEDLAGNVAEWTADNYEDAYEAMPAVDPVGPSFGTFKVVRGGGFAHALPWLRGAARAFRNASAREPHLGFRCAADARPR
jgi:formylglycine-generating enzyme required for sulfatase activity